MLKPRKALAMNCRFCFGTATGQGCGSTVCSFNAKVLTLQRIKAGCRECAGDHDPESCTGQLAGWQRRIMADLLGVPVDEVVCPLHPYRMGKDPYSRRGKHTRTPEQINKLRSQARFRVKSAPQQGRECHGKREVI